MNQNTEKTQKLLHTCTAGTRHSDGEKTPLFSCGGSLTALLIGLPGCIVDAKIIETRSEFYVVIQQGLTIGDSTG